MGPVDLDELRRVVDGRWADVRAVVRERVPAEWCRPEEDSDREAQVAGLSIPREWLAADLVVAGSS